MLFFSSSSAALFRFLARVIMAASGTIEELCWEAEWRRGEPAADGAYRASGHNQHTCARRATRQDKTSGNECGAARRDASPG